MKYNRLGHSKIKVSEICLGSMTWGTQNTEQEGHQQIDCALDRGVNFIDTAEMYPTNPLSPDHAGRTEEIIGNWLASRKRRGELILATKVTGAGSKIVRDGEAISKRTIDLAVEGSLRRLKTDYIDLYQLHWPNRGSYHFRQNWRYDATSQDKTQTLEHIHEVLQALQRHVEAGRIRQIGLSNESCWGTAQFLRVAEEQGLPRVVSVQNEYSLLYRQFDLDMAELAHNEDVGLLAFSPLAAGMLSGKYAGDIIPPGSRRSHVADLGGRYNEYCIPALDAYLEVAREFEIDSCQMSLAFCLGRPFMTSAIVGATSVSQLENSLAAVDLCLGDEVLEAIWRVYRRYPVPM